jgi:hypothetical protein
MSAQAESLIASRRRRIRSRERLWPRWRIGAATTETALIFLALWGFYGWLGYRLTVNQHLVIFDAAARLAHAFFVWYGAPSKLAAIGFVWAPVSTLVYLPFALFKPLATSLAAIPLMSAFFGAALIAVLGRTLSCLGLRRWLRYPLLLAFAANPMIVFYSTNGMSETSYLFLLMLSIHYFIRWYTTRATYHLIFASVAMTLGVLDRYELAFWAALMALALLVVLMRERAERPKIEGSMLMYLVPITYGLMLWVFFNWLIIGDPLFWLKNQVPGAGGQQAALVKVQHVAGLGVQRIAHELLTLNLDLFPLAVAIIPVLLFVWLVRRDGMSLCLAAMVSTNAVITGVLMYWSKQEALLQLRYNMRAMPIALIATAWVISNLRRPSSRTLAGLAAIAAVAACIPVTWHAMKTYPFQYEESVFARAMVTGEDQEGKSAVDGYHVGIRAEKQMAAYILAHVHGRHEILTDDSQSLEVMTVSGHPELFFDRIDKGDATWYRVLNHPFGRVRYFLLSTFARGLDLIQVRFQGIATQSPPWVSTVFADGRYKLLRIASCPSRPPGYGLKLPARCLQRQSPRGKSGQTISGAPVALPPSQSGNRRRRRGAWRRSHR